MELQSFTKCLRVIYKIFRGYKKGAPGSNGLNKQLTGVEEILKTLLVGDCNWTRTHNHLVHKRTLNHLAKLAK